MAGVPKIWKSTMYCVRKNEDEMYKILYNAQKDNKIKNLDVAANRTLGLTAFQFHSSPKNYRLLKEECKDLEFDWFEDWTVLKH